MYICVCVCCIVSQACVAVKGFKHFFLQISCCVFIIPAEREGLLCPFMLKIGLKVFASIMACRSFFLQFESPLFLLPKNLFFVFEVTVS